MSNIQTYLQQILDAVYGEEVRGSIHDAIATMNSDLESAILDDLNPLAFKGELGVSGGTTNNLNNLTSTDQRGIWRLLGSRTYTNVPSDFVNSKQAYLIQYAFGTSGQTANIIKQELHYFSDTGANATVSWSRIYISGEWQDWHKSVDDTLSIEGAAADAKSVSNKGYLLRASDSISDLDDAISPGWYILAFAVNYGTTDPVGPNHRRLLEVTNGGGVITSTVGYVIQRLICFDNVANYSEYIRYRAGSPSTWSTWIKVSTKALAANAISGITDLNDFSEVGYYSLDSSVNYTNLPDDIPSGSIAKHLINTGLDNGYLVQRLFVIKDATVGMYDVYTRVRNTATNWNSWKKVYSMTDFNNTYQSRLAGNETDLNNMIDLGLYGLAAGTSYTNEPPGNPGGGKYLTVDLRPHTSLNSAYTLQRLHYLNGNIIYQRIKAGSPATWGSWSIIYSGKEISDMEKNTYQSRLAGNETDLNNMIDLGLYGLAAGTSYTNEPPGNPGGAKYLTVEVRPHSSYGSGYAIQQMHYLSKNITYQRSRSGSPMTWSEWTLLYDPAAITNLEKKTVYNSVNAEVDRYVPTASTSQGANTGDKLRVVTYNICMFNFDTSTFISDEKLYNLRKCLGKMNADAMFIQEDNEWIDALTNGTKRNDEYVYYPLYPYAAGVGAVTVRSKLPLTNVGLLSYTTGRSFRYGVMTLGSKRVLLISTHMTAGFTEDNINTRKAQYNELLDWVNGTSISGVSAPQFTHCIIGMDSNAHSRVGTNDDKTNLAEAAAKYGYNLANGGRFGWMYSECRSNPNNAIDTILCSPNIIINNVEVHSEWYSDLYSDHVPVVCDLTLLGS